VSALSHAWVAEAASGIAARAERELEALVGVSSPSGDRSGAEEAIAVTVALLPAEASVERIPCSSPGHADDLVARLGGRGSGRILLLGHLDTVVGHAGHRPLERDGDRLVGSGAIDMKGGIVLALGVMGALAAHPGEFAELALLAVVDEEWRIGQLAHGPRFAGYDACLCFEGGERGSGGEEAVITRRKAAATVEARARGVAAHSGASPERGRNALLALGEAALRVAALNDPDGPDRLTAVPTVIRSGDAFNVVPASGELVCDLRADSLGAFDRVLAAISPDHDGVEVIAEIVRRWPGMDTGDAAGPALEAAGALIGRPVIASERGGASDASHLAAHVPLTIDGLGPLGGGAHTPEEHVTRDSLRDRAELACALTAAVLARC
jgi:glutamate carboxypeptidase